MLPGLHTFAGGDAPYPALGVLFDGTNDVLNRGADLTFNANSKTGFVSYWFRRNGGIGNLQRVWHSQAGRVRFGFDTNNELYFVAEDTTATIRLHLRSVGAYSDTTTWHHAMASWDMTDTTRKWVYVDDVDVTDFNTFSNNILDYTNTDHAVGGETGGANKTNADLAEFFFHGNYVDLSVEANRRKFRSSSGRPVDLGVSGTIPLGSAPGVFLAVRPGGAAADFVTNRGSGGGFTLTGALTLSATNP